MKCCSMEGIFYLYNYELYVHEAIALLSHCVQLSYQNRTQ